MLYLNEKLRPLYHFLNLLRATLPPTCQLRRLQLQGMSLLLTLLVLALLEYQYTKWKMVVLVYEQGDNKAGVETQQPLLSWALNQSRWLYNPYTYPTSNNALSRVNIIGDPQLLPFVYKFVLRSLLFRIWEVPVLVYVILAPLIFHHPRSATNLPQSIYLSPLPTNDYQGLHTHKYA